MTIYIDYKPFLKPFLSKIKNKEYFSKEGTLSQIYAALILNGTFNIFERKYMDIIEKDSKLQKRLKDLNQKPDKKFLEDLEKKVDKKLWLKLLKEYYYDYHLEQSIRNGDSKLSSLEHDAIIHILRTGIHIGITTAFASKALPILKNKEFFDSWKKRVDILKNTEGYNAVRKDIIKLVGDHVTRGKDFDSKLFDKVIACF